MHHCWCLFQEESGSPPLFICKKKRSLALPSFYVHTSVATECPGSDQLFLLCLDKKNLRNCPSLWDRLISSTDTIYRFTIVWSILRYPVLTILILSWVSTIMRRDFFVTVLLHLKSWCQERPLFCILNLVFARFHATPCHHPSTASFGRVINQRIASPHTATNSYRFILSISLKSLIVAPSDRDRAPVGITPWRFVKRGLFHGLR